MRRAIVQGETRGAKISASPRVYAFFYAFFCAKKYFFEKKKIFFCAKNNFRVENFKNRTSTGGTKDGSLETQETSCHVRTIKTTDEILI